MVMEHTHRTRGSGAGDHNDDDGDVDGYGDEEEHGTKRGEEYHGDGSNGRSEKKGMAWKDMAT